MKRWLIVALLCSCSAWAQTGEATREGLRTSQPAGSALKPKGTLLGNILVQGMVWAGGPAPASWPAGTPFTVGIPIRDSAKVKAAIGSPAADLKLCTTPDCSSGQAPSQFRVLGLWPSGNVKWVEVDGQTTRQITPKTFDNSINLVKQSGGGNFGGSNLAVDNGKTITVNTGTATVVIQKANFDLFHKYTVGGTILVSDTNHESNDGLVILGPPPRSSPNAAACNGGSSNPQPGEITVGTFKPGLEAGCNTTYRSNLDLDSSAVIEENGPLRAAIKATGSFASSSLHCVNNGVTQVAGCYLHYTVREFFYKNQSGVKVQVELRNADFSSAATFASAYKQFASFSAQVKLNITPSHMTVAGCAVAGMDGCTSALSAANYISVNGTDDAYLYQAFSRYMEGEDWPKTDCTSRGMNYNGCVVSFIHRVNNVYAQNGYKLVKNGREIAQAGCHRGIPCTNGSNDRVYSGGWADVTDASSNGVEIGVYQLAAYWPKSLELNQGVVVVGIWPNQAQYLTGGDQPYVIGWPKYQTHDLYFNFHAGALPSQSDFFLRQQQQLIARVVPYTYYNDAVDASSKIPALLYPFNDPIKEDAYLNSVNSNICRGRGPGSCLPDGSYQGTGRVWPYLAATRFYMWTAGGSGNQTPTDWNLLRNFLNRGCAQDASGNCTLPSLRGSVPGRFAMAKQWARWMSESALPHSDFCGGWRGTGSASTDSPGLRALCPRGTQPACSIGANGCTHEDGDGTVGIVANDSSFIPWNAGQQNYADTHEHAWWYGLPDYYFFTGDESVKETLLQGFKDVILNDNVKMNNPNLGTEYAGLGMLEAARTLGHRMSLAAHMSFFLRSIRDPEADTSSVVLAKNKGTPLFTADNATIFQVSPDLPLPQVASALVAAGTCASGDKACIQRFGGGGTEPGGGDCVSPWYTQDCASGISATRGLFYDAYQRWPWPYGSSAASRDTQPPFQASILANGLWDYRLAADDLRGPNWRMRQAIYAHGSGPVSETGDLKLLDDIYAMAQGASKVQYAFAPAPSQGPMWVIFFEHLNWTDMSPSCQKGAGCRACTSQPGPNTGNSCSFRCDLLPVHTCVGTDHWFNFLGLGLITNSDAELDGTSWRPKAENQIAGLGAQNGFGGVHASTTVNYLLDHAFGNPNNPRLTPVSITLSPAGCSDNNTNRVGTCTIHWTPPPGLCTPGSSCPMTMPQYRLKYYACPHGSRGCPKAIVNWLGWKANCLAGSGTPYPTGATGVHGGQAVVGTNDTVDCSPNPNVNGMNAPDRSGSFALDPASHVNWFAATDVPDGKDNNSVPAGSSYTFTTTPNTTYTFSLSAYASQRHTASECPQPGHCPAGSEFSDQVRRPGSEGYLTREELHPNRSSGR